MPDPNQLLPAVAARYAGGSRFARHYVGSKLRRDPATAAILAEAARVGGFGVVLDLGCGLGQLSLALLQAGLADSVHGLDRAGRKLDEARLAAAAAPALAARFRDADLASAEALPPGDTVLIVDVLYQIPEAAQFRLLRLAASAARRRVLVRAFDPTLGWRSRVGLAMEVLNRALRGDHAAAIRPVPPERLIAALEAEGFRTRVAPCWGGTPLPNVLLVAERA